MASIWNPEEVLGLHPEDDQSRSVWRCVAHVPKVAPDGSAVEDDATQRCQRPIRPCEHNTIRRLLADMSHELPDQVDHNLLLHLARACLCVDGTPEPHRGRHEASVIYEWTELMCNEAWRLREPIPSDLFTRDPFKAESSTSSSNGQIALSSSAKAASKAEQQAWDEDADLLSPRSVPGRVVSARTRLQSVSASTISQRRGGGNSPTALSPSSARTPTAITTAALTMSTAHNSAHHPHAPPSPPDSATFVDGTMPSSTGMSAFPNLPIYHPVPLSFGTTTGSTVSSSTSAPSVPAHPSIVSPPLPTGTTMQTSSSTSSDQPFVDSTSIINAADDEEDGDEEGIPDTPYGGTVFETASSISASPTTATTAFATGHTSFAITNGTAPPPLPMAMTITTQGSGVSSNCSSVISSTGNSSVARADDTNMDCAIMSMPPRASVAAAEVAARRQKRQRRQQQRQKGRAVPQQPPTSQVVGARGRQRSRSRSDHLHLRRVSLSNIRRLAELENGGSSSATGPGAKAMSIGPGDSVSVRHLQHPPASHPQQQQQQQEEFPPMSAVGMSFSSSSSSAADAATAAPPPTPPAEGTDAEEAATLAGQLRECAEALRGARAACVEDLNAARSELAAVRAEVAAVRAELVEARRAVTTVAAAAAATATTNNTRPGDDGGVAAASKPAVLPPSSPMRCVSASAAACVLPRLLLLPLAIVVWVSQALVHRLRAYGGSSSSSSLPPILYSPPVSVARAVGRALAAVAGPVARLADMAATAYGQCAGAGEGGMVVVAMEPLRRRPGDGEVVRGKDSVGKMV